mmetsp:Transcript_47531/g.136231  ORF Transcript_47531/g.136231 Transcript_47531/m.136231 type:complete len:156 (+) Transcript_47531:286-753(+)
MAAQGRRPPVSSSQVEVRAVRAEQRLGCGRPVALATVGLRAPASPIGARARTSDARRSAQVSSVERLARNVGIEASRARGMRQLELGIVCAASCSSGRPLAQSGVLPALSSSWRVAGTSVSEGLERRGKCHVDTQQVSLCGTQPERSDEDQQAKS